jgi:hypothetical protein
MGCTLEGVMTYASPLETAGSAPANGKIANAEIEEYEHMIRRSKRELAPS